MDEYPYLPLVSSLSRRRHRARGCLRGLSSLSPIRRLRRGTLSSATFRWEERDLIVLSQSCDLVKGREKVTDVLLCAVWRRSELTEGYLATNKGMEDARRGNLPGFHVLAACPVAGLEREIRVVDFRRVYSLP